MLHVGTPEEETLNMIGEMNPDFVGIPLIASANYLPATRLSKAVKENFPGLISKYCT